MRRVPARRAGITDTDTEQKKTLAAGEGLFILIIYILRPNAIFVLLPRRWIVERIFIWAARFCRLAKDYESLDSNLRVLHCIAFAALMLTRMFNAFL
ncbi:MAG TPA: transposase [Edaphobacter sp.]|nr:transposase [Edaphobacter sp.]